MENLRKAWAVEQVTQEEVLAEMSKVLRISQQTMRNEFRKATQWWGGMCGR